MVPEAPPVVNAKEMLKGLYHNLILVPKLEEYATIKEPSGTLADIAFREQFNIPETQETLDELSALGKCRSREAGKDISFESSPGLIYLLKNEDYDGRSYQEIYLRKDIDDEHKLHILGAEMWRGDSNSGRMDIGVYITDKSGEIVKQFIFNYKTNNRLNYSKVLPKFVEKDYTADTDLERVVVSERLQIGDEVTIS